MPKLKVWEEGLSDDIYIKLEQNGKDVDIVIVDIDGYPCQGGCIARLSRDGYLFLYPGLNGKKFGLQMEGGCIETK